MALRERLRRTGSRPSSEQRSMDLLPTEIRETQRTKRWFNLAAVIAGTLIVIVIVISVIQRIQISSEESTLREEQARAAQLRAEVEALRPYEVLKQTVDGNRLALATALAGDINWAMFLDDLDQNIPSNSSLSSLSVANVAGATAMGEPSLGTIQYAVTVKTFPGLADWLDKMEASEGQRFVYMSSGTEDEASKVVSFSASAHLTEVMASGRCQTETAKCP